VLGNLWATVFHPLIFYAFKKWFTDDERKKGNDALYETFDVSFEYLHLLYRQFIVFLGMSIFPLVSVLGLVAFLVEYRCDKLRFLKLSKNPHRMNGSMKFWLVVFLFINAVLAAASFPNGTIWILSGFYYDNSCPNSVYQS